MSALVTIFFLQLLAVVAIVAEFVLPSAGVLSVTALVLIGYSLYRAFDTFGIMGAMGIVVGDLVILPLAVLAGGKLLSRSPLTLRSVLASTQGARVPREDLEALIGKQGIAHSILRPAGIAIIDGRRVDVVTRGDFVDTGTPVTVVAVEGNQVIVERASESG